MDGSIGILAPESARELLSSELGRRVIGIRHISTKGDESVAIGLCGKPQSDGKMYIYIRFYNHPEGLLGRLMEIKEQ